MCIPACTNKSMPFYTLVFRLKWCIWIIHVPYLENNDNDKEPSLKRIKIEKSTDQPNESVFMNSHDATWKGNSCICMHVSYMSREGIAIKLFAMLYA